MIIYESTKSEFMTSYFNDTIESEIYTAYKEKIGQTSVSEFKSWKGSMQYMGKVLQSDKIPKEASVAIEFKIPLTSKRIDFIITGKDDNGNSNVIIIELKGWETVEKVEEKDGIVKTPLGTGIKETNHPSYQALTYAMLIKDFNEDVQKSNISLYPCSYLYHLDVTVNNNKDILDKIYTCYITESPVFVRGDVEKLQDFISKYIKHGDNKDVLYILENGKISPSKSLQDSISSMLKGNVEFRMIDEQKVVYETAFEKALRSKYDMNKRVLIVEGGPGTGKSVVAINLLANLTKKSLVCQYISKNSAPRNIYSFLLKKEHKKGSVDNMFRGSGSFVSSKKNEFDVLLIDEAHRLNEKSGMFKNLGENQVKEIINASKFSVFFIDEDQRVDISDIGSIEEIKKQAKLVGVEPEIMKLESQFRCNGSNGYLAWLDDILQIRETANSDGFNMNYDIQIVDDPNTLKNLIFEKNKHKNKSRLLAGYCWDWLKESKNNHEIFDININDFHMSWNLGNTQTWAIDEKSVNQIGCIHTSQGLEFDYAGVIIGPDLIYRDGKVITDFTKRAKTDQSIKGLKSMNVKNPLAAKELADRIIKNTYRTLLTRGQKGCYIYCCDKELEKYLKERLKF